MKTIARIGLAVVGMFALAVAAEASDVTIPNVFTTGTTASAAQVNLNFAAVEAAVDNNDARLDAIEGGGVTSAYITNGTIATVDIANSAITGTKVATDTLTATNIAAGAIGASELGSNATLAAVNWGQSGGIPTASAGNLVLVTITPPAANGYIVVTVSGQLVVGAGSALVQVNTMISPTSATLDFGQAQYHFGYLYVYKGAAETRYPLHLIHSYINSSTASRTYYCVGQANATGVNSFLRIMAQWFPGTHP